MAQIVVAAVAVIGLVYILKLVIVTILFSMLLAFVLEPFVSQLVRLRIPRAIGALLAVSLLVGVAGGTTYFFYSRAVDFATQLPKYSRPDQFPAGKAADADQPNRGKHPFRDCLSERG